MDGHQDRRSSGDDRSRKRNGHLREGSVVYPRYYPDWYSNNYKNNGEGEYVEGEEDYYYPSQSYHFSGTNLYDNTLYVGQRSPKSNSYRLPTESEGSDEFSKSNKKTCGIIAAIIMCVFLIAVALGIGIYFGVVEPSRRVSQDKRVQSVTFQGSLKINRTFTPQLNDPNSTEYKALKEEVTTAVDNAYRSSSLGVAYGYINVTGFSSGSIVVGLQIYFIADESGGTAVTVDSINTTLTQQLTQSSSRISKDIISGSLSVIDIAASTTPELTTRAPTTAAPTTMASTTQAPNTQAPTTKASTTSAPTTAAPTSSAATTASTTQASTSQVMTTKSATTSAPTTKAPTTAAPTSETSTTTSTTKALTTAAPTTQTSATTASTTKTSTTASSTSQVPTTASPTTGAPTTKTPTTAAATTKPPTTVALTTKSLTTTTPTTKAPTTAAPTTKAFTTAPPTTQAPTTTAATTKALTAATLTANATTTAPPTTKVPTTTSTTKDSTSAAPTTNALTSPASTTKASTTAAPTTQASTTAAPTTQTSTTAAPTTQASTTAAPTTKTSTTASPTSKVPTTAAPTTKPPTTVAPTTKSLTTAVPTTHASTTAAPTTQTSTTAAPTTKTSTIASLTSKVPTTAASTTAAPTTKPPTSVAPTTKSLTTAAPTTKASTTAAPTMQASTASPTTQVSTTAAPTTKTSTTATPTSKVPTTAAPTTKPPTTVAPTTQTSTTAASTTQVSTTAAPTTKTSTTATPTSKVPTTAAPTTKPPTTVAPTTKSLTTAAPTTKAPTTAAPTTQTSTTAAPTTQTSTTAAPTTKTSTIASPTSKVPTTAASTTAALTTKAPTTVAPTTKSLTTAAPTTKASTTAAPTMQASTASPTTQVSTTAAPTTKTSTTASSTFKVPTTAAPTTKPPTTVTPTTNSLTTTAPTTKAPTTASPTTKASITAAPTTKASTTAAPTTQVSNTAAPTTKATTTAAPTSKAPTTAAHTTKASTTAAPTAQVLTTAASSTQPPTTATLYTSTSTIPKATTTMIYVTTMEVITTTIAAVVDIVELNMTLNQTFNEKLRDENSSEYQTLKNQSEAYLTSVLKADNSSSNDTHEVESVQVIGFLEGSLIIRSRVLFRLVKMYLVGETRRSTDQSVLMEKIQSGIEIVKENPKVEIPDVFKNLTADAVKEVITFEIKVEPCRDYSKMEEYLLGSSDGAGFGLCEASVNMLKEQIQQNGGIMDINSCSTYHDLLDCLVTQFRLIDGLTCDWDNSFIQGGFVQQSGLLSDIAGVTNAGKYLHGQCLQIWKGQYKFEDHQTPGVAHSSCTDPQQVFYTAKYYCPILREALQNTNESSCRENLFSLAECVKTTISEKYSQSCELEQVFDVIYDNQDYIAKSKNDIKFLNTCAQGCSAPYIEYLVHSKCQGPIMLLEKVQPANRCRLFEYTVSCLTFISMLEHLGCDAGTDVGQYVVQRWPRIRERYPGAASYIPKPCSVSGDLPTLAPLPDLATLDVCSYPDLFFHIFTFDCKAVLDKPTSLGSNICRYHWKKFECVLNSLNALTFALERNKCSFDDVRAFMFPNFANGSAMLLSQVQDKLTELSYPLDTNEFNECYNMYENLVSQKQKCDIFLSRRSDKIKEQCSSVMNYSLEKALKFPREIKCWLARETASCARTIIADLDTTGQCSLFNITALLSDFVLSEMKDLQNQTTTVYSECTAVPDDTFENLTVCTSADLVGLGLLKCADILSSRAQPCRKLEDFAMCALQAAQQQGKKCDPSDIVVALMGYDWLLDNIYNSCHAGDPCTDPVLMEEAWRFGGCRVGLEKVQADLCSAAFSTVECVANFISTYKVKTCSKDDIGMTLLSKMEDILLMAGEDKRAIQEYVRAFAGFDADTCPGRGSICPVDTISTLLQGNCSMPLGVMHNPDTTDSDFCGAYGDLLQCLAFHMMLAEKDQCKMEVIHNTILQNFSSVVYTSGGRSLMQNCQVLNFAALQARIPSLSEGAICGSIPTIQYYVKYHACQRELDVRSQIDDMRCGVYFGIVNGLRMFFHKFGFLCEYTELMMTIQEHEANSTQIDKIFPSTLQLDEKCQNLYDMTLANVNPKARCEMFMANYSCEVFECAQPSVIIRDKTIFDSSLKCRVYYLSVKCLNILMSKYEPGQACNYTVVGELMNKYIDDYRTLSGQDPSSVTNFTQCTALDSLDQLEDICKSDTLVALASMTCPEYLPMVRSNTSMIPAHVTQGVNGQFQGTTNQQSCSLYQNLVHCGQEAAASLGYQCPVSKIEINFQNSNMLLMASILPQNDVPSKCSVTGSLFSVKMQLNQEWIDILADRSSAEHKELVGKINQKMTNLLSVSQFGNDLELVRVISIGSTHGKIFNVDDITTRNGTPSPSPSDGPGSGTPPSPNSRTDSSLPPSSLLPPHNNDSGSVRPPSSPPLPNSGSGSSTPLPSPNNVSDRWVPPPSPPHKNDSWSVTPQSSPPSSFNGSRSSTPPSLAPPPNNVTVRVAPPPSPLPPHNNDSGSVTAPSSPPPLPKNGSEYSLLPNYWLGTGTSPPRPPQDKPGRRRRRDTLSDGRVSTDKPVPPSSQPPSEGGIPLPLAQIIVLLELKMRPDARFTEEEVRMGLSEAVKEMITRNPDAEIIRDIDLQSLSVNFSHECTSEEFLLAALQTKCQVDWAVFSDVNMDQSTKCSLYHSTTNCIQMITGNPGACSDDTILSTFVSNMDYILQNLNIDSNLIRETFSPYKCTDRGSKQGYCPISMGARTCVMECTSDYACNGSQKCCSNNCGYTCQHPVSKPQCPNENFTTLIKYNCSGPYNRLQNPAFGVVDGCRFYEDLLQCIAFHMMMSGNNMCTVELIHHVLMQRYMYILTRSDGVSPVYCTDIDWALLQAEIPGRSNEEVCNSIPTMQYYMKYLGCHRSLKFSVNLTDEVRCGIVFGILNSLQSFFHGFGFNCEFTQLMSTVSHHEQNSTDENKVLPPDLLGYHQTCQDIYFSGQSSSNPRLQCALMMANYSCPVLESLSPLTKMRNTTVYTSDLKCSVYYEFIKRVKTLMTKSVDYLPCDSEMLRTMVNGFIEGYWIESSQDMVQALDFAECTAVETVDQLGSLCDRDTLVALSIMICPTVDPRPESTRESSGSAVSTTWGQFCYTYQNLVQCGLQIANLTDFGFGYNCSHGDVEILFERVERDNYGLLMNSLPGGLNPVHCSKYGSMFIIQLMLNQEWTDSLNDSSSAEHKEKIQKIQQSMDRLVNESYLSSYVADVEVIHIGWSGWINTLQIDVKMIVKMRSVARLEPEEVKDGLIQAVKEFTQMNPDEEIISDINLYFVYVQRIATEEPICAPGTFGDLEATVCHQFVNISLLPEKQELCRMYIDLLRCFRLQALLYHEDDCNYSRIDRIVMAKDANMFRMKEGFDRASCNSYFNLETEESNLPAEGTVCSSTDMIQNVMAQCNAEKVNLTTLDTDSLCRVQAGSIPCISETLGNHKYFCDRDTIRSTVLSLPVGNGNCTAVYSVANKCDRYMMENYQVANHCGTIMFHITKSVIMDKNDLKCKVYYEFLNCVYNAKSVSSFCDDLQMLDPIARGLMRLIYTTDADLQTNFDLPDFSDCTGLANATVGNICQDQQKLTALSLANCSLMTQMYMYKYPTCMKYNYLASCGRETTSALSSEGCDLETVHQAFTNNSDLLRQQFPTEDFSQCVVDECTSMENQPRIAEALSSCGILLYWSELISKQSFMDSFLYDQDLICRLFDLTTDCLVSHISRQVGVICKPVAMKNMITIYMQNLNQNLTYALQACPASPIDQIPVCEDKPLISKIFLVVNEYILSTYIHSTMRVDPCMLNNVLINSTMISLKTYSGVDCTSLQIRDALVNQTHFLSDTANITDISRCMGTDSCSDPLLNVCEDMKNCVGLTYDLFQDCTTWLGTLKYIQLRTKKVYGLQCSLESLSKAYYRLTKTEAQKCLVTTYHEVTFSMDRMWDPIFKETDIFLIKLFMYGILSEVRMALFLKTEDLSALNIIDFSEGQVIENGAMMVKVHMIAGFAVAFSDVEIQQIFIEGIMARQTNTSADPVVREILTRSIMVANQTFTPDYNTAFCRDPSVLERVGNIYCQASWTEFCSNSTVQYHIMNCVFDALRSIHANCSVRDVRQTLVSNPRISESCQLLVREGPGCSAMPDSDNCTATCSADEYCNHGSLCCASSSCAATVCMKPDVESYCHTVEEIAAVLMQEECGIQRYIPEDLSPFPDNQTKCSFLWNATQCLDRDPVFREICNATEIVSYVTSYPAQLTYLLRVLGVSQNLFGTNFNHSVCGSYRNMTGNITVHRYSGILTLDREYQPELLDRSSFQFRDLDREIIKEINRTFYSGNLNRTYVNSTIRGFRNGSVIVYFESAFSANISTNDVLNTLIVGLLSSNSSIAGEIRPNSVSILKQTAQGMTACRNDSLITSHIQKCAMESAFGDPANDKNCTHFFGGLQCVMRPIEEMYLTYCSPSDVIRAINVARSNALISVALGDFNNAILECPEYLHLQQLAERNTTPPST